MWLTLIVFALAVAAVLGGTLAGGIFTIVLIPLAVIAVLTALITSAVGAKAASASGESDELAGSGATAGTPGNALPRTHRRTGHVATTPERLADARREQQ